MEEESRHWQALKRGSREAFGWIFHAHYRALIRYGGRINSDPALVEDCIQDLFLKIWQRRERLADVVSVRAYLFKSLKLTLIDAHRKLPPDAKSPSPAHEPSEADHESVLISQQTDDHQRARLTAALGRLSQRQQEVIHLKFQERMSNEEISAVLEISYQATRNLLYVAIKVLREYLAFLLPAYLLVGERL